MNRRPDSNSNCSPDLPILAQRGNRPKFASRRRGTTVAQYSSTAGFHMRERTDTRTVRAPGQRDPQLLATEFRKIRYRAGPRDRVLGRGRRTPGLPPTPSGAQVIRNLPQKRVVHWQRCHRGGWQDRRRPTPHNASNSQAGSGLYRERRPPSTSAPSSSAAASMTSGPRANSHAAGNDALSLTA